MLSAPPVGTDAIRDLGHEPRIEQDHATPVDNGRSGRRGRVHNHFEVHFQPADTDNALDLGPGLGQIDLLRGILPSHVAKRTEAPDPALGGPVVSQIECGPFRSVPHCPFCGAGTGSCGVTGCCVRGLMDCPGPDWAPTGPSVAANTASVTVNPRRGDLTLPSNHRNAGQPDRIARTQSILTAEPLAVVARVRSCPYSCSWLRYKLNSNSIKQLSPAVWCYR